MYKKILFLIAFMSISCLSTFAQETVNNTTQDDQLKELGSMQNPTFYQVQKAFRNYFESMNSEKPAGFKQFKRWEAFCEPRVYPDGKFPSMKMTMDAVNAVKAMQPSGATDNINWSLMGPVNIPAASLSDRAQGLGRINIIRFHPQEANTIWAGAASGGVWRSTNNGSTWTPFDFTSILSLGVSDIQISESNPNIIYVATGDIEPSNNQMFYSIGVLKTVDAGQTWTITNLAYSQENGKKVGRLWVNPTNPDIVIACSTNGLYKSVDGGNTWTPKINSVFCRDLVQKPGNPNILYMATMAADYGSGRSCSVYKSTDMGDTWKVVTTLDNCWRVALATTPANSSKVYLVAANTNRGLHSIRVSNDEGASWNLQYPKADDTNPRNLLGRSETSFTSDNAQGEYDLCIAVHPDNEDLIYIGGINIYSSNDGGLYWSQETNWTTSDKPFVHADQHDLKFNPHNKKIYASHDGGINYLDGLEWTDITNGLSITQYYRISTYYNKAQNKNMIVGGAQDNGTNRFFNNVWSHIHAGDGMTCLVDNTNSNIMYVSGPEGDFVKINDGVKQYGLINKTKTGEAGGWITPMVMSKSDPELLFAGYSNVWRSYNGGGDWTKISSFSSSTMTALAVAPSNDSYLYAGYNNGIWQTSNGSTWTKIPNSPLNISYIAVDPANPTRVWFTCTGFNSGTESTKVYFYDGTNLVNLSGNLPNIPVNCISIQPNSPDRIFVGTDIGLFYSEYQSANWEPYGKGLPNVSINDINIVGSEKLIRAATFGRGIWEATLIDCKSQPLTVTVTGNTTICPNENVHLEAPEGYTEYLWSNGATTRAIDVNTPATYSVAIKEQGGCMVRSNGVTIKLKVLPELKVACKGSKAYMCSDQDSVVLYITKPNDYSNFSWSSGQKVDTIVVRTGGQYKVTATANIGCVVESPAFEVIKSTPPEKPSITIDTFGNIFTCSKNFFYQWVKNNKIVNGATGQTFKATESGTYKVRVKDSTNNCETYSDIINWTLNDVDDMQLSSNIINIYPNPSDGIFRVDFRFTDLSDYDFIVTNLLGAVIYRGKLSASDNDNSEIIDLSGHSQGIYYITITDQKGKSAVGKLIKQ